MQATRLTSHTQEEGVSAPHRATAKRTRRRETVYRAVDWEYPPSPAACRDALLSRGALHSRFLRIAHLSTRERFSTPASRSPIVSLFPTSTVNPLDTQTFPLTPAYLISTTSLAGSLRKPAVRLPHIIPYPLSPSCVTVRPRSANPVSHTLKRRKPLWPKPPHYHASLLRSPLSRRKGLFRAVLPPNKAVDFFRWDILLSADVSFSAPYQERDRTRTSDMNACAPLLVAESVLAPYEAAAGFFGWRGLGLDVIRPVGANCDEVVDDGYCWSEEVEACRLGARMNGSPSLQLEVDEVAVEEGRTRWRRTAEELVGPPGLAVRWVGEGGKLGRLTTPSDPGPKDVIGSRAPSSISSRCEEIRWDPDIDTGPFRSAKQISVSDEKRRSPPSNSKSELKVDSSAARWCGPSPNRGPPPTPHLPPLRFPPAPSVQYGHFSPWVPPSRVASAQGHGYWYGVQPIGAPPSINRDPSLPQSLPSHPHISGTPITPASMHASQSPRCPIRLSLGRDECAPGYDYDKETETDHGYESTTTTTDSDPPPHTPIGAAITSHCVEALQVHGDDEAEVHGVEIDAECMVTSVTLSDPTTPVKLLDRFTMSTSPPVSSGSPDFNGCGSSKAAVVFPSLNGSFRQGSLSQIPASLSGGGISMPTTPAGAITPASSSSLSSAKELTTRLGDEDNSRIDLESGGVCSISGDNPAFMLSLCSPPPVSPSPGLRKDSQGFWEPMMPISPSSSSSSFSLSHSPSEGKVGSGHTTRCIGEKIEPTLGESPESSEAASSQLTHSTKSRSLSPGPRRVIGTGSTRPSSSMPASFFCSASTSASRSVFGGSYASPSPTDGPSLVPPNPTALLPAFLATATVKRKKASRTREIVDRLRSSSIDADKGGGGLDGLGWLASPSAGGEVDGTLGKASSGPDHDAGSHVARGQPSPSPPSKSSSDSASWLGSDLGKNHSQAAGSKSSDSGPSGSRRKNSEATQVAVPDSETRFSLVSPGTATTTANPSITPFPILSVSQTLTPNFTISHQSQTGRTTGRQPVTTTPFNGGDGSKMNATAATSPSIRSSGPQLLPSTPSGGTSPSAHPSHHPLPSPPHPTVHPQPSLGPSPSVLTVSPYPHPMYVPFTQYHLTPLHQGQQGQGTWLALYPGSTLHPLHSLPAQPHVSPITGVPGMRHVSW